MLTDTLNDAAQQLTNISASHTKNLTNLVTSANSYAKQIADLNISISQTPEGTTAINALMDQRSYAASQLAEAVGGTYLIDSSNNMSVSLGGATFVGPANHSTLQVATAGGTTSVQWSRNDCNSCHFKWERQRLPHRNRHHNPSLDDIAQCCGQRPRNNGE